jgi:hypothetical protein
MFRYPAKLFLALFSNWCYGFIIHTRDLKYFKNFLFQRGNWTEDKLFYFPKFFWWVKRYEYIQYPSVILGDLTEDQLL